MIDIFKVIIKSITMREVIMASLIVILLTSMLANGFRIYWSSSKGLEVVPGMSVDEVCQEILNDNTKLRLELDSKVKELDDYNDRINLIRVRIGTCKKSCDRLAGPDPLNPTAEEAICTIRCIRSTQGVESLDIIH